MRLGRSRMLATVMALTGAVFALPAAAWASFTGSTTESLPVGSATLLPPSNVSTNNKCNHGAAADYITMTWTVTPTQNAAGYTLLLRSPTTGDITQTVAGRSTSSITVAVVPTAIYTVTVSSTAGNWSAAAPTISAGCNLSG